MFDKTTSVVWWKCEQVIVAVHIKCFLLAGRHSSIATDWLDHILQEIFDDVDYVVVVVAAAAGGGLLVSVAADGDAKSKHRLYERFESTARAVEGSIQPHSRVIC